MSPAAPAVSIVVIAYQQHEPLLECLESCMTAAERVNGGAELMVVDNGDLAELVRIRAPEATLLRPGRNLGFAGGVSLALGQASGSWIALVNDDARVEREALRLLLQAGEGDASIGAVAAQVRFHAHPGRVNSAGIEVNSLGVATERLAGAPVTEAAKPAKVFGPSGCFALYRSAMLRELGGLDEGYFAYLEDVDLAWRAQAAGWRCIYEPAAIAFHRGSASSGEGSRRKYFLVGRNRVRLLARNATAAQLVRALPGIVLYDLSYIAYAALTDRTLAPLRGRLAGLREWRKARAQTADARRPVRLAPAWRGWSAALRQHRAYRDLGAGA